MPRVKRQAHVTFFSCVFTNNSPRLDRLDWRRDMDALAQGKLWGYQTRLTQTTKCPLLLYYGISSDIHYTPIRPGPGYGTRSHLGPVAGQVSKLRSFDLTYWLFSNDNSYICEPYHHRHLPALFPSYLGSVQHVIFHSPLFADIALQHPSLLSLTYRSLHSPSFFSL